MQTLRVKIGDNGCEEHVIGDVTDLYNVMYEYSSYSEEGYDEMLDDSYGDIDICGNEYSASYALKEIDPTAYRCGYLDWLDEEAGEAWDTIQAGGTYYMGGIKMYILFGDDEEEEEEEE